MRRKLNNFILRYTWLLPLLVAISGVLYYMNWFERLFDEYELTYRMPIFKELEISIGILLLITSLLNWALVGFWRHLYSGRCEPKWEIKKK